MNATGHKRGQVKRLLNAGKPITGELLEFALTHLPNPEPNGNKYDELWAGIVRKLKAGEPLGGYEHHVVVDVALLHIRLAALAAERSEGEG